MLSSVNPNKIFLAVSAAALFSLVVEGVLATWKIISLEYENEILVNSINDPQTGFIARSLTCEMNIQELRNAMTSLSGERRAAIAVNDAKIDNLIDEVKDLKSSSKVCQR